MNVGSLLVCSNNMSLRWRHIIYVGTQEKDSGTHVYLLGDGSLAWTNDDLTQLGWIEFI